MKLENDPRVILSSIGSRIITRLTSKFLCLSSSQTLAVSNAVGQLAEVALELIFYVLVAPNHLAAAMVIIMVSTIFTNQDCTAVFVFNFRFT